MYLQKKSNFGQTQSCHCSILTANHIVFKIYVANRVTQVFQSPSADEWNYIESAKNPAEICVRVVFNQMDLLTTDKHGKSWLSGPSVLYLN